MCASSHTRSCCANTVAGRARVNTLKIGPAIRDSKDVLENFVHLTHTYEYHIINIWVGNALAPACA